MDDMRQVQLSVTGMPIQEASHSTKDAIIVNQAPPLLPSSIIKSWKRWFLVAINILFVLSGQTVGNLLSRFYFDQGGNSKWMLTLISSAGFPILIPILLFSSNYRMTNNSTNHPSFSKIASIYIGLGLITTGDNLMYSYGLYYLPVSTFSLISASQLAFNALFSYFINSQKFTHLIFNSVVLLTFASALLVVHSDSTNASKNYPLGFILTLGASAIYSLILSLIQLTFQRVQKRETFSVVLEMSMFLNIVATSACMVGLFSSGEWRGLKGEMEGYGKGRTSYIMTLVGIAISWQVFGIGIMGLTFIVSSLFSNVISTVALPIGPIFAIVFFSDKMDGVKVVSMLIAIWGFFSYVYQQYLDDLERQNAKSDANEICKVSCP